MTTSTAAVEELPPLGASSVWLIAGPFDGEWVGLSPDWADLLPCSTESFELLQAERRRRPMDAGQTDELGRAFV